VGGFLLCNSPSTRPAQNTKKTPSPSPFDNKQQNIFSAHFTVVKTASQHIHRLATTRRQLAVSATRTSAVSQSFATEREGAKGTPSLSSHSQPFLALAVASEPPMAPQLSPRPPPESSQPFGCHHAHQKPISANATARLAARCLRPPPSQPPQAATRGGWLRDASHRSRTTRLPTAATAGGARDAADLARRQRSRLRRSGRA
jgi:hypothetical protein